MNGFDMNGTEGLEGSWRAISVWLGLPLAISPWWNQNTKYKMPSPPDPRPEAGTTTASGKPIVCRALELLQLTFTMFRQPGDEKKISDDEA